jgi:hypothetical protein
MTLKRLALFLLYCTLAGAQTTAPQKAVPEPCDKDTTFCWYGPYGDGSDEVKVWGKRWFAKEQGEEIAFRTALRCLKRMSMCIKAENVSFSGSTILRIEILPVTSWTREQINAEGENTKLEPCERDSYIINRMDQSVLMISSPGPMSDRQNCKAWMGPPKTIVYKLMQ